MESTTTIRDADVLVVEDNELIARSLGKLISQAGFQPAIFHFGGAALQFAQSLTTAPAAAIVDIHLPDLSGLILSHKLRELFGAKVPIIILSGDTSMETLNSLSHVGATYFFSKPVNTAHLLERLKEWIEEGRSVAQ